MSSVSVPVLEPNWNDFQNFNAYIEEIESNGYSAFGMVKVFYQTKK